MKTKVLIALFMLFIASCTSVPTREENLAATEKATSRALDQNQGLFQACVQDAVRRSPGLKGTATLVWIQNDEGYVRSPRIRDMTFKDADFEDCVLTKIKSMRFPPSAEDSRAKVSLELIVQ
ncbi:AgmX/PglI C-terminal domain-containing protein [Bdellovibrio bacteriovorus]|uniref:AgmX/PglI C-terminal domain-containing protein n=1 Tax=Bdellovibrio bacteriovorus TaxID=959 RepID=UPI0021D3DB56|nr:AgmX/PglI C-terminal domain-containing protein [Bdellovibrio bacteriovorus]UXR63966.1 AgmX/PglI C-terminal domain-containing protein [Bdellovibrio bacteriovorus]